jgi:hypothetical protein
VKVLAFQVEDGIDDVLQHARPGDGTLLGDVPNDDDGHVGAFGQVHQAGGALAHLADRAGTGGEVVEHDRLDRIDHGQGRHHGLDRGHDGAEVDLGHHEQARRNGAQPVGAQLNLLAGLLARDVQHLRVGSRQ